MHLFLLLHTTVEPKNLKLGIYLNLKAASFRLSRYHLIAATLTHRTLLCTMKDTYAWRQLCIEISDEMSQGKPSSRRQYHRIKISRASFGSLPHKSDSLHYILQFLFQSLHSTNPHISITPPRPLIISTIANKWQVMIILASQYASQ